MGWRTAGRTEQEQEQEQEQKLLLLLLHHPLGSLGRSMRALIVCHLSPGRPLQQAVALPRLPFYCEYLARNLLREGETVREWERERGVRAAYLHALAHKSWGSSNSWQGFAPVKCRGIYRCLRLQLHLQAQVQAQARLLINYARFPF